MDNAGASSDQSSDEGSPMGSEKINLLNEVLKPRVKLPPLLVRLEDLPPEKLHYLGVSFGLTSELFRFWKKSGYVPLYLRQTPNELTGEHSCIMIKEINTADDTLVQLDLDTYWKDFQRRFVSLLAYQFRCFKPSLALEILKNKNVKAAQEGCLSKSKLSMYLTQSDLLRLKLYSNNMVDYHMIVDLLPALSRMYFTGGTTMKLTLVESSIVLALGLQHKTVEDIEKDLELPVSKILGQFKESISKFVKNFRELKEPREAAESEQKHQTLTESCGPSYKKSAIKQVKSEGSDSCMVANKSHTERKHKLSDDSEQPCPTEGKKRKKLKK